MHKKITIRYFAQLRELAKQSQEELLIEQEHSVKSIYEQLSAKYSFPLEFNQVRLAVNDKFVDAETMIVDGDSLVFIPPVAGG